MKLPEVLNKLSSSDLDVLRLCDSNAETLLANEKLRGERAEDKAQDLLKMCAAGATILLGGLGFLYTRLALSATWTVLLPFVGGILFILKSAWFSLMVFEPIRMYRATQDLVFDTQEKSSVEALRYMIAVKLWLFELNVPKNTLKLLYLDRAMRNFTAFIFTVLLSGVVLIALLKTGGPPRDFTLYLVEAVMLLVVVMLDPVSEKLGKLWNS